MAEYEQRSEASTSGVTTRKRCRIATPHRAEGRERTAGAAALQKAMQEIQQLRAERLQQHADMEEILRQRDDQLRRMEERLQQQQAQIEAQLQVQRQEAQQRQIQLSPPNNRAAINLDLRENNNFNLNGLGFKLKPDNYDGNASLQEFLTQFNLIARANAWNDIFKTVVLASCLRGKARSVLDGILNIENLSFDELKGKLELRFGEGHLTQTYYTQFANRKQKFSEDFATLGADLEKLSRLAYPFWIS